MKKLLSVFVVLFCVLALVGCAVEDTSGGNTTNTGTEAPQDEWVTLIEFSGTFSDGETEFLSDTFETSGGDLRVTYDLVTTSTGGNALIYILPEGWTKTKNPNGDLKIAVQDITAIGTKTGAKETVKKDAGVYFVDINTSSVESYKIKVEEKKQ